MPDPLKKSYDKPRQHIKKQRHPFANKGPYSQSYGFSSSHVWMWDLEHKEGEIRRIDTFKLRCWRRLLRVPGTSRRSNPSIIKEIHPDFSLEGLMLKMKFQYFGHLMWRADSLEKIPDAGKDWGQEEKAGTEDEMVGWHHRLSGHEFHQLQEMVKDREACHAVVHWATKSWTWLGDWSTTIWYHIK